MIKKITIQDFESAFGEKLSSFVREKISGFVFEYEEVQEKEKDPFWTLPFTPPVIPSPLL